MSENSFTRRDFMRLGAGAAALGAAPKSRGLSNTLLGGTSNAEDSPIARSLGTDSEMAVAEAWLRAFRLPSATSMTAKTKLLPDVLNPPFSFVYGDQPSAELLPAWKCEVKKGDVQNSEVDDTKQQQEVTYTDPQSGLVVRCVAATFRDFPAVEWVINLKNTGDADTAILQNIQALDTALMSPEGDPTIHYAKGAACSMSDFMPMTRVLGNHGQLRLQPGGGRSSSQFLPFFNIEGTGEGAILAIGWSGEWAAEFDHPGESPHFQIRARDGFDTFEAASWRGDSHAADPDAVLAGGNGARAQFVTPIYSGASPACG